MSAAEQLFYYSERLKTRVTVEVERSKLSDLQDVMIIANKMESLVSSSYSSFGLKDSCNEGTSAEEPTLIRMEYINCQQNRKFFYAKKWRRIENRLCFDSVLKKAAPNPQSPSSPLYLLSLSYAQWHK